VRQLALVCALSGAALSLPVACTKPGPSLVSQGQRYHVADAEFDAYFAKLYALHVEVETSFEKEGEIRKRLVQTLGNDEEASSSLIAKAVRRRSQTLAHAGVFLRFELEDDDEKNAQAEIVVSGRRPADDTEEFLKTLSVAARDELKLSLAMSRARRELEELRFQATRLEKRIDDAFRLSGPSKKAEIRNNLEDSLALIPVLIVRADELREDSHKLLDKLVDAVRIDAPPVASALSIRPEGASDRTRSAAEPSASAPAAAEAEAAPERGRRRRAARASAQKPRPAAARPAAPPPKAAPPSKPAPPPKPEKPPAADFEP
jgi:hypothetical protein